MNQLIELSPPRIEIKKLDYSPIVRINTAKKTKELPDNYLRIDFVYFAEPMYEDGGWVRIYPNTFIRPSDTSERLEMIKAEGIPIAPNAHFFKSVYERLYFSLYFPSVPKDVDFIDIIEREGGGSSFFNFYRVAMSKILSSTIQIQGTNGSPNRN